MSVTNYQVVNATSASALAAAVLVQIGLGYQPLGPVSVALDESGRSQMFQAMILGAPLSGAPNTNIATVDPGAANDNTQGYQPGSFWINTANNRVWMAVSVATGAAVWALDGVVPGVGIEPSNMTTQFGGGVATFLEEGNISRQVPGVAGAVAPGAIGADNVVAVYSLPANSFDQALRGLTITAAGQFAANANTKRVKLWFNPSTAVVGSTIGAGGSLLADTGAVTTNSGGWEVGGNVFKRGAAGSNTQTCTSNGAVAGGVHVGVVPPLDATAVESGAILVAVTINNTTAVGDASLCWLEVNGMN